MSFKTIISGALATIRAVTGSPVTYSRGAATVALTASKSKATAEVETQAGMVEYIELWDFIIGAADLVLDGRAARPQIGDRIMDECGTYEVLALAGIKHYTYCDGGQSTLRVHTKCVKNA